MQSKWASPRLYLFLFGINPIFVAFYHHLTMTIWAPLKYFW